MNNMSLHFNDYEKKIREKILFYFKNINVVMFESSNLGFEEFETGLPPGAGAQPRNSPYLEVRGCRPHILRSPIQRGGGDRLQE